MPRPATQTTIEVPPSYIQAALGTVNEKARTIELVFSTGATFLRYDFLTGRHYNVRFSLDGRHVRLDRLNNGAPLLNAHSSYDLSKQVGVVVDKSAVVSGKEARCTVRFSRREEVEPIWQDVKDRIIRNVSVGATIHKFEETRGANDELPLRTAVDWEPFEVSLVPIGADDGAMVKAGVQPVTNPCLVVARRAGPRLSPAEVYSQRNAAHQANQQDQALQQEPVSVGGIYAARNRAYFGQPQPAGDTPDER